MCIFVVLSTIIFCKTNYNKIGDLTFLVPATLSVIVADMIASLNVFLVS